MRAHYAYAVTAVVLLSAVHILVATGHRTDFAPYFGAVDPRISTITIAGFGAVALMIMHAKNWRPAILPDHPRAAALWFLAAAPFAVVAIGADLLLGFPHDLNVPAPWAFGFYPAMGFAVEVVFHAIPLALFAVALGERRGVAWLVLLSVALIEPAFQLRGAMVDGDLSTLETFVFVQVFAINLVELYVFRRHGFLSALGFRLSYYLLWHVLWGHWRLL